MSKALDLSGIPFEARFDAFSCISGLRMALLESSGQVGALQAAYAKAQEELEDLEGAALAACRGIERAGGPSGSSLSSRLRALGGHVAERLKGALRLGVQKALGVVSTHYLVDFEALAEGYSVPEDLDDDATLAFIDRADDVAAGPASKLAPFFEADVLDDPDEEADAPSPRMP